MKMFCFHSMIVYKDQDVNQDGFINRSDVNYILPN